MSVFRVCMPKQWRPDSRVTLLDAEDASRGSYLLTPYDTLSPKPSNKRSSKTSRKTITEQPHKRSAYIKGVSRSIQSSDHAKKRKVKKRKSSRFPSPDPSSSKQTTKKRNISISSSSTSILSANTMKRADSPRINPRSLSIASSSKHVSNETSQKSKVDVVETPQKSKSEEHILATTVDAAQHRNALFAELNQGDGVKAHLTHLTKEEKAKRRAAAKKSGGKVEAPAKSAIVPASKAQVAKPKPPPFFTCVADREWIMENFTEGVHEIAAEKIAFKHSISVRNCENTTLIVHGKCSNLLLDSCTKTNVVFNGAMAGAEMIRCKSSNIQIIEGACPTFTLDHVHSANIYMNAEAKAKTNVTTTCCSGLNIWFPSSADPEEMICRAVPEQFTAHIGSKDEVDVRVSDLYLPE